MSGGFGDEVLVVAPAGLRAAAVVEAVLPVALRSAALFGGEVVLLDRVDVRRAIVVGVERFFSSSEAEGWLRCDAVEEDVVGRLAAVDIEPGGGRVGGLLSPPAEGAVREAELAVGFVAALPVVGAPRRAGTEVEVGAFFAAVELVAAGFGELDSAAGSGAGASVCCTTSKPSASDMSSENGVVAMIRKL